MSYLIFELKGDMAMWRNPYESMGAFSCLGPSPSNLAGLLGAALGFASPKSQGMEEHDETALRQLDKKGLPWPVSPELLKWQKENDLHLACRWLGGHPRRQAWNVNGCKELDPTKGNLRMQQQVIERPHYEVAVCLEQSEAERLAAALNAPAFPLSLGASFCRAFVLNISVQDAEPEREGWAYWKEAFAVGETTPFSQHVLNAESTGERIKSTGFWVYPTPSFPREKTAPAFVKTYCVLEDSSQ